MSQRSFAVSLVSGLLLSACAVTRVDPPPPVTAPQAFKESAIWQRGRVDNAAQTQTDWWQVFHDPVLNDLMGKLVVGNENLKSLAAQVASAKAALEASRRALWPTLSVGPSLTRSHTGSGDALYSSPYLQQTSNSVALSANASWEVDLWGRLSEASRQAQAGYQASKEDLAAARLSAQATLVQTYLSMRTAEAQIALLTRSLVAYEKSQALTQARYASGVAARSDVLQATGQGKSTEAPVAESRAQRGQQEHALAVLIGAPPYALNLETGAGTLPSVPVVPAMLPSQLLERRPDIAAARHRVEAAYAQIGVADAAYFPALTLTASGGYRNQSMAGLISAPNLFWSIGPSLTEMILDGGQRMLASAQARASAEQATSTYRQTVLTALQEVEDNLVLADQLQQEGQALDEALVLSRRNLDIVMAQYQSGTVSYLNVVVAQTSALSSESNLLQVRNRQLAAASTLLKNLAGDWRTPAPSSAP
jgi:NodT family efflux transporter outer membrane factor (OMF) lipoprotein